MSESEDKFELKEMQKLQGHTDRVWSVAWNPVAGTNGKPPILASCSGDKTVRVWTQNPTTSAFYCMATIDEAHTRTVRSCSWSPTGHLLAVASFDGTVSIWDKIETSFKFWCYLEGHKNEVKSVSWDASGAHVATCSRDKSVCIWRVLTETEHERLATFIEHTHDVKMVQWHPCKDILFSCSYDNTIKVWPRYSDSDCWYHAQTLDHANNDDLSIKVWGPERMQSGHGHVPWKHLQTISGNHDRTIFSVHWSSEGIIASGAADDAICLFEENRDGLESEATYKLLLKKVKAHETDVNSVQWSPKEIGLLASSSDDGTVKIWKLTCRQ